ncbi:hypothetical protein HMPREF0043_00570 [Actinobaculum sp. oral taxon 183 str. F0552]|nr:hypothetical protein HMPREF0043_00570 [Actinobaculum sp. oral taxon 183 str. F0552]
MQPHRLTFRKKYYAHLNLSNFLNRQINLKLDSVVILIETNS